MYKNPILKEETKDIFNAVKSYVIFMKRNSDNYYRMMDFFDEGYRTILIAQEDNLISLDMACFLKKRLHNARMECKKA